VTGAPTGGGSGSGWVAEYHDPVTVVWSALAGSGATALATSAMAAHAISARRTEIVIARTSRR